MMPLQRFYNFPLLVIPVETGIHFLFNGSLLSQGRSLDSCLRGNDDFLEGRRI